MNHSVWILGDQLLTDHPALKTAVNQVGQAQVRVVLVQSQARTGRLPYQRKKLVLLFSAMRHYAQELAEQGYQVDYITAPTFLAGLRQHVAQHRPARLWAMAASEYNGRFCQTNQLADQLGLPVAVLPNTQFLIGRYNPIPQPEPERQYVMEYFYRDMRRHFDVLMVGDEPVGGQWNYDKENRKPLPADNTPPADPYFEPDEITQSVMAEVAQLEGIGTVDGFGYAVTRAQANAAWGNFMAHRLTNFGPYEDAMSQRSHSLYHSLLSPYLNIGLLEPMPLIRAAERAYHEGRAPLNSVEGFVRQLLGWRELDRKSVV